ncbi:hypothetical protein BIW11_10683 [Tropilaelaps mercedesae]|uniref:G-protein coupled receptors family 1 profile domain-containing protein n=1 Tax=Tropilaelaps mercedesae TaxID=418985 RepID=A0A1V9XEG7_9ACAR|nr:hypothetical protein BIW11_10683 [Tropilaelaps mercedesae]
MTLMVSALRRYLTACHPNNHLTAFLVKHDLNILVWIGILVINLPNVFVYASVAVGDDEFFCALTYELHIFTTAFEHLAEIPLVGYAVLSHLVCKMDTGDADPVNPYNLAVRRGARFIRTLIVVYVIIFTPLVMIMGLRFNYISSTYVLGMHTGLLTILLALAEPLCFAFPDETFLNEFRLHIKGQTSAVSFPEQPA